MHFMLKINVCSGFSHCSNIYKAPCKISAQNIGSLILAHRAKVGKCVLYNYYLKMNSQSHFRLVRVPKTVWIGREQRLKCSWSKWDLTPDILPFGQNNQGTLSEPVRLLRNPAALFHKVFENAETLQVPVRQPPPLPHPQAWGWIQFNQPQGGRHCLFQT